MIIDENSKQVLLSGPEQVASRIYHSTIDLDRLTDSDFVDHVENTENEADYIEAQLAEAHRLSPEDLRFFIVAHSRAFRNHAILSSMTEQLVDRSLELILKG